MNSTGNFIKIDAHQHFWTLARGDYGWLTPELKALYRDFSPDDLAPLLRASDIGGTVLVQAAPTMAETEFMLEIADRTPFVKGVIGWVDFEAADAPAQIARLAKHPALVGLRPMIQDIADKDWMLRPALTPAFEAMIAHQLTFEALTLPRHLKNLHQLLTGLPDLRVVIDHGSKPEIAAGGHDGFDGWAEDMAALAADTNAFCKLSGLVTEAGKDWQIKDLRPYSDHLLAIFGPERLIWGSDWPVLTLAASWERWQEVTAALLAGLTPDQHAAILGGNAQRAWQLRG